MDAETRYKRFLDCANCGDGTLDLDKMRCLDCGAMYAFAAPTPTYEPSRWQLWREWWQERPPLTRIREAGR